MDENLWSYEYKKETIREKRANLLLQMKESDGEDSSEYRFRKEIFDHRYITKDGQEIDTFIRGWVLLSYYQKGFVFPGDRNRAHGEADETLKAWFADREYEPESMEERVVLDELYNMTLLYLTLCEDDKNFGSLILGIGRMKEDRLHDKIAHTIRSMAVDLPKRLGMERQFKLFTRAAGEAFRDRYGKDL